MKDIVIGIDAGTSVIKSIAFSLTGRALASHALTNHYATLDNGGVEQDMARTWSATAQTLQGLAQTIPDIATRVAAIAVTGQGDGTWLVDKAGGPVAPAWLWLDARATQLVETASTRPDERARFELTGTGLAACQQGMQLQWMAQHAPDVLARTSTAMQCKDWLYFNLTGERATDPSEACFTFGDVKQRCYSDTVIDTLELSAYKSLLPPIIDGTQHTHPLSAMAAQATGLTVGTPVCLGYVDVICTALGAGLYDTHSAPGCSIVGSTGMHMRLKPSADDIVFNEAGSGYTMAMPIPGVYAQMQSNMASTLNIDWLLDVACDVLTSQGVSCERATLIPYIDQWISTSRPASALYQPYVSEAGERGPFIDGNARAGFVGLSTRHGFAELVRTLVEGLAFAARDCYNAMGPLPDEIRLTGGAARSGALRQVFGAVLDANVRTSSRDEAGAAGAAMMAAVAIGAYQTMDDCVDEWVTPLLGDSEAQDAELARVYHATYPVYADAHTALRPVWSALAQRQDASQ